MWKKLVEIFRQDDLYTQALQESHAMLDLDLKMFDASVETLRRSPGCEVDIDVYAMDKQINAYERDVRRKVLTHLSLSGPGHLSSGLVLVSVVIDIERIGDYAKNIFDLARNHPKQLHAGVLEPEVARIEARVCELFRKTVEAFKTGDVEQARAVMVGYKGDVARVSDELVTRIIGGEIGALDTSEAASTALYLRYLKRIAAHSRNIMTSLVNPFERIGYREKKKKEK